MPGAADLDAHDVGGEIIVGALFAAVREERRADPININRHAQLLEAADLAGIEAAGDDDRDIVTPGSRRLDPFRRQGPARPGLVDRVAEKEDQPRRHAHVELFHAEWRDTHITHRRARIGAHAEEFVAARLVGAASVDQLAVAREHRVHHGERGADAVVVEIDQRDTRRLDRAGLGEGQHALDRVSEEGGDRRVCDRAAAQPTPPVALRVGRDI